MVQHGEFQPYVTAEEAERRARACAERLSRWFEVIPSAEQGEHDPLVQQANARAGGETLSDIKADAGGKVGHTTPPTLFEPVARASLCESQESGLIRSFQVFGVGDDLHLLMSHSQGVDANQNPPDGLPDLLAPSLGHRADRLQAVWPGPGSENWPGHQGRPGG